MALLQVARGIATASAVWWRHQGLPQLITYVVIPAGLAGVSVWLGAEVDDFDSMQTAATFFVGLLLNLLFRVFEWSRESSDALIGTDGRPAEPDPFEAGRHLRRLDLIERTYESVTWATIASLVLTTVLFIVNTRAAGAQVGQDLVVETAVVVAVGSHLLLVIASVVSRTFNTMTSDLKKRRDQVRLARHDERGGQ